MKTKITFLTIMLAIFSTCLFAQPNTLNKREKLHPQFLKEKKSPLNAERYQQQEKEIPSFFHKAKQDRLKKEPFCRLDNNTFPDLLEEKEKQPFPFLFKVNKQNFTSNHFPQKAKNVFNVKTELKQRLDSVVRIERDINTNEWLNSSKEEYAYNDRGNLILEAYYHWNSETEQWEGDDKYEYTYDERGNLILVAAYQWNSETEQWEGYYKSEYTYDERGNLILEAYYHWNSETEQWEGDDKYEYTYDENGNLILETDYEWNSDTVQWKVSDKYEYTYDERDNRILKAAYQWNSETEQWEGLFKYEYAYDEKGNLTLEIYYYWNSGTEQWERDYKYECAYGEWGNLILETYYQWNSETEQWEGFNKYEYAYDERGNFILAASYYWNWETEQWEGYDKYEYAYDKNGNIVLRIEYNWNNINQQWQAKSKYVVAYDYNYSRENLLLPFGASIKNKLINVIIYESEDGITWEESGKEIYYYSDLESAVPHIPIGSIKLYPNPVANDLNIDLSNDIQQAEFKLFDLQGRLLVTQNIGSDKKINLEKLAGGIYLYQITTEKGTYQGKLIK